MRTPSFSNLNKSKKTTQKSRLGANLAEALGHLFETPFGKNASNIALPAGTQLFGKGEESDHLYLVRSGRLGVFRHSDDHPDPSLIGIVGAGEPVGEMSLIAGSRHSASVKALRDSDLLALPRQAFLEAIEAHPDLLWMLTRKLIERTKKASPHSVPTVFGFYALCDKPIRPLIEGIYQSMLASGLKVAILDKDFRGQGLEAFTNCENENDFVLHIAEGHEAHWRHLSCRQVDHIYWVVDGLEAPNSSLIEGAISLTHTRPDLIFMTPKGCEKGAIIGRTKEYLHALAPHRWFHMNEGHRGDSERLGRILSGTSIGLVLSGGGARAFAHIGAVKALLEANIKFDFIGGTSMGAIIGAGLANSWDFEETEARIREAFVESSPLDDISFPFVAMSSGKKVDQRLADHFGNKAIEDLPLPFYAVSANLTSGMIKVHNEGDLALALRASVALPGIIPPVIMDNQVLVDGGVMRSFPTGLMRHLHLGTVVGIDVTRARGLDPESIKPPSNIGNFVLGGEWRRGPPIVSILMRSATISTAADLAQARAATDFLIIPQPGSIEIRDFHAYDEAVLEGYRACIEGLKELTGPIGGLRQSGILIHPNVPTFTVDPPPAKPPKPIRKNSGAEPKT